ncbi:hypothetical protein NQ317_000802 [Molorchus minor]|uniref:Uncharacterized protein n=1 Tax=Molorchus minor TaxID=1323400 RepID=A0ABQ9IX22_9CUCU|nr:hypothetical protein NQ317_000802 [Molorchus minor]
MSVAVKKMNDDQWNDTRNTVGSVNKLINDNFLPENQPENCLLQEFKLNLYGRATMYFPNQLYQCD